jgi:hypothetical protein
MVDVLGPRDGLQPGSAIRDDRAASGHRERHSVSAVLPLFTLRYGQARWMRLHPNLGGGINNGSVLYVFGRVILD